MRDDEREKFESRLETLAEDIDEDAFDGRATLGRDIPPTLPRMKLAPLETLPPLNPLINGEHSNTIHFLSVLDSGGMGEIHIARQKPMGRHVAVKRLRKSKRSQKHRDALLSEGAITGRLQHPNIVPVYTLGRDEGDEPAIVMKLIEGVTLGEILDDFEKLPHVFAAESQLESHIEILLQVCNAVSYTHDQGIIHRDIKPENIMVGDYGEVYLLDWGIATAWAPDLDEAEEHRGAEGTPAYMAPEMAAPTFAALSPRTDVFLLGACLHEILTGEAINDGETYFELLSNAYERESPDYDWDVPEQLAHIAKVALARHPSDRYASVVEFRDALRDFLNYQTSWRLAEVARSKLAVLEEKIAGETWAPRGELYPLFGACRFGFQHALEVRPDNQTALDGLQRAVEAMIRWELDKGGVSAAEILLNVLPKPNQALAAKVEQALDKRMRIQRESQFTQMSPDAVVAVDESGHIVYVNNRTSELFGYESDELVGEPIEILVPRPMRDAHVSKREDYMDDPTSRPMGSGMELEGVRKDGSRVPVDISLAPARVGDQTFTVASVRPIDEPAETSPFGMDASPFAMLDVIDHPVFIVHSGRIVWCNSALARAVSCDEKESLLSRDLGTLFGEDTARFPKSQDLGHRESVRVNGVRMRTENGRTYEVDMRFSSRPGDTPKSGVVAEIVSG